MAKRWDSTLKRLMGEAPQNLISWLKQGIEVDEELSTHLGTRNIDADILYRVRFMISLMMRIAVIMSMTSRLYGHRHFKERAEKIKSCVEQVMKREVADESC